MQSELQKKDWSIDLEPWIGLEPGNWIKPYIVIYKWKIGVILDIQVSVSPDEDRKIQDRYNSSYTSIQLRCLHIPLALVVEARGSW